MKWLSKAGQLLGTPAENSWTQPEAKPHCSEQRALDPTSNHSLSYLSAPSAPWSHLPDTHGHAPASHHCRQSLDPTTTSPSPGATSHTSVMKSASSESLRSKHGHIPQPLLRKAWDWVAEPCTYLKTIHFAQQKPSYSIAALRHGDWLLASMVTPLILPKSSCSISPLQRAVVYFGMLFFFCKKYFVFV